MLRPWLLLLALSAPVFAQPYVNPVISLAETETACELPRLFAEAVPKKKSPMTFQERHRRRSASKRAKLDLAVVGGVTLFDGCEVQADALGLNAEHFAELEQSHLGRDLGGLQSLVERFF